MVFGELGMDQPTVFYELTVATIKSPCFKLYGASRNLVMGKRQYVFRNMTGFSPSQNGSSTNVDSLVLIRTLYDVIRLPLSTISDDQAI